MPRLAGKAAFLTGAGNGIGRATAILSPAKAPKSPLLRSPPEPVTKPLTLRETKRSRSEPTWGPRRSPKLRLDRDQFGGVFAF
jgi:hypothetical protein